MRIAVIAVIVVLLVAVGAGCYGLSLLNWSSPDCPKGQHLELTGEIPVSSKYGTTLIPIYGCES